MKTYFGLSLDVHEDVANIVFDYPDEKANKLSAKLLLSFSDILTELESRKKDLRACFLKSAKPDIFIAGADIEEIRATTDPRLVRNDVMKVHEAFLRLERLPFPVIALIHGACLGGGLELSLACHYRIATDHTKTKIGLPEVMLGIIPGFGGTQRLPRLIGLQRALPLILAGKVLDAKKALRSGIVDAIVPPAFLEEKALEFLAKLPSSRKKIIEKRMPSGFVSAMLESVGKPLIFSQARKSVLRQTKGHYPAPLHAIEAIRRGIGKPLAKALEIEADYLSQLAVSRICKNLILIYYQTERIKKSNGIPNSTLQGSGIVNTAVLGAGVMGGGIAQLFADKDMDVRLKDISWDAIGVGKKQVQSVLSQKVKRRRISKQVMNRKLGRVTGTTDYRGFYRSDLVVEAIVENMDIKKKALSELCGHVTDTCVIASNTSSLSISDMGTAVTNPGRFAGLHFFNPVHRMPLVEIIRGNGTSDETVATLFDFSKEVGKTPIVVNDGPGFLVNRLLLPYLNEACFMVEEGCPIDRVDGVMTRFGMPMGPCLLIDEVGIDVAHKVSGIFQKAFGNRVEGSGAIEKLHAAGRLGKKGSLGFYRHGDKKPTVDPEVYSILRPRTSFAMTEQAMIERMVFAMINEAARCLDEKIVGSPDDVDIGMIFGTGFPPFRGGLLKHADEIGPAAIVASLESMSTQYGRRFLPCDFLKNLVKENRHFYS